MLIQNETLRHPLAGIQEAQPTEELIRQYADVIDDLAMISISDRLGRIVQVNNMFCRIFGYAREELLGENYRILNSGLHTRSFFVEMWLSISRGEVWRGEVCNRSKCGDLLWLECINVPLQNSQKKVEYFLSLMFDVTKLKQREFSLRDQLKEVTSLYAIRRDMELNFSMEVFFDRLGKHLIQAMHFPEIAMVDIEVDGKHYSSEPCPNPVCPENKIQADIIVKEHIRGQITVTYCKNSVAFLSSEQNFLDLVVDDLRLWLERKAAQVEINHMATHDALTNLPNRYLLQDRIQQAIAHCHRNYERMAILFLDLDHFKEINDSLGHDAGDELLKRVADRLQSCVRGVDTVSRQGGDEFILVLSSFSQLQELEAVIGRILDSITKPYDIGDSSVSISISIGISLYPDHGCDPKRLLRCSDIAVYRAKENGGNSYVYFTPEMDQVALERHYLSADLREALGNDELMLYFQPVRDIGNTRLISFEALLRWQHLEKGWISPSKFIPLAEENGLIVSIGQQVLEKACAHIKNWWDQGLVVPPIAINISVRQVEQAGFVEGFEQILKRAGVPASCFILEITESVLARQVENMLSVLDRLQQMGFSISIDDFGTGYSCLSYLKRYPIHSLKIDRSFIQDIFSEKSDKEIVKAVIALAHSLDLRVIAEGVESLEQLKVLADLECDAWQGFFSNAPLPASEITGMLSRADECNG